MEALIQAMLNGLVQGLIYVAIAVGLTIVFGTLRLVNFAHGAFYAIGAYVGCWSPSATASCAGFIAAPIAVAFFAVVLDRAAAAATSTRRTPTAQILVTFGIALVVEESLRLIFGATTQQFPTPAALKGAIIARDHHLPGVPAALRRRRDRDDPGWSGSSWSARTTA